MTIETLIEAATPMLERYSMWIGDTLRSTLALMSSGSCVCCSSATVGAPTSAMSRSVLTTYSRRACAGMSLAG